MAKEVVTVYVNPSSLELRRIKAQCKWDIPCVAMNNGDCIFWTPAVLHRYVTERLKSMGVKDPDGFVALRLDWEGDELGMCYVTDSTLRSSNMASRHLVRSRIVGNAYLKSKFDMKGLEVTYWNEDVVGPWHK